jgi:hypothetical protein
MHMQEFLRHPRAHLRLLFFTADRVCLAQTAEKKGVTCTADFARDSLPITCQASGSWWCVRATPLI